MLPIIYWALRRTQDADAALKQVLDKYHDAPYWIATIYAYRGEADAAFAWLERAYRQRDNGVLELRSEPIWRSLAHDPRFAAFLVKMKLADG